MSFLDWLMRMGPGGGVYNAVAPQVQAGLDAVQPFIPPELRGKVKGLGQVGHMISPATNLAEFPGALQKGDYGHALLAGLGSVPGDPLTPLAMAGLGVAKAGSKMIRGADSPVLHGDILPPLAPTKMKTNEEIGGTVQPVPKAEPAVGFPDWEAMAASWQKQATPFFGPDTKQLQSELLEILGPTPAKVAKPTPAGTNSQFLQEEEIIKIYFDLSNFPKGSPEWTAADAKFTKHLDQLNALQGTTKPGQPAVAAPWGPATKLDDNIFPQIPFVTGEPVEDAALAMNNYTAGSPAWKALWQQVYKGDSVEALQRAKAAGIDPNSLLTPEVEKITSAARSYTDKWKSAGTPGLNMNEAARTKRRDDQGYTVPSWHGTRHMDGSEIRAWPSTHKTSPWPGTMTSNLYSSSSPKLADMYAWSAWRHPDSFPASGYGNPNPAQSLAGVNIDHSQHVPLRLNTSDYHTYDAGGKSWTEANSIAIKEAKAQGKSGVVINNVWDEPQGSKVLEKPNTVYITFNPATARSPFAKFDPAKKDMNNLLAGLAGASAVPFLPWLGGEGER